MGVPRPINTGTPSVSSRGCTLHSPTCAGVRYIDDVILFFAYQTCGVQARAVLLGQDEQSLGSHSWCCRHPPPLLPPRLGCGAILLPPLQERLQQRLRLRPRRYEACCVVRCCCCCCCVVIFLLINQIILTVCATRIKPAWQHGSYNSSTETENVATPLQLYK